MAGEGLHEWHFLALGTPATSSNVTIMGPIYPSIAAMCSVCGEVRKHMASGRVSTMALGGRCSGESAEPAPEDE